MFLHVFLLLGCPWALLDRSWALLGCPWPLLGPFGAPEMNFQTVCAAQGCENISFQILTALRPVLGALGAVLAALGGLLDALGETLGTKIDIPAVLVANIEISKNIGKNIWVNSDF